ncbi:MAG: hypothetical protein ACLGSA_02290 [Acidobacteriota bacterium]
MSSVSTTSSLNVASYFKDIILDRQQRQDERTAEGVASGAISAKNKELLAKSDAKNDALVTAALKDGKVTRDEYDRIMKALDTQNAVLDKLMKSKDKATLKKESMGDATPMQDQDMALAMLQKNFTNIGKAIEAGVKSGKITEDEKGKLDAVLEKSLSLMDKAMEDGTISKGEFSTVIASLKASDRQVTTYSRNRRTAATVRREASMNVTV